MGQSNNDKQRSEKKYSAEVKVQRQESASILVRKYNIAHLLSTAEMVDRPAEDRREKGRCGVAHRNGYASR